jgi:hypothetical protein
MQAVQHHLNTIVRPALTKYVAAEKALDLANDSKDQAAIDAARNEVMQAARTAATELHHLQDVVLVDTAPRFVDLDDVRKALRAVCVFARGPTAVDDTDLLRDTAEAFKHFVLTRPSATVSGASAIVSISNGCGEMRYGEQKYSGREQVTVTRKNGHKYSLLWICQNSYDAWMNVLGMPEQPYGDY